MGKFMDLNIMSDYGKALIRLAEIDKQLIKGNWANKTEHRIIIRMVNELGEYYEINF